MLRVLLVLGGVLAAGPVWAAEGDASLVTEWSDAHYICRMNETRDGEPVSESVAQENCDKRADADRRLAKAGYCWDKGEQEWLTPADHDCKKPLPN